MLMTSVGFTAHIQWSIALSWQRIENSGSNSYHAQPQEWETRDIMKMVMMSRRERASVGNMLCHGDLLPLMIEGMMERGRFMNRNQNGRDFVKL